MAKRRRPVHTAKFDRCVRDVKRRGGVKNPGAVCQATLGKKALLRRRRPRERRSNPATFVITARRPGGPELKYTGTRFATQGNAIKFPTRALADQFGEHLKSVYAPKLRRYKLKVGRE